MKIRVLQGGFSVAGPITQEFQTPKCFTEDSKRLQKLVIIHVFFFCMKPQINRGCKFPLTQWYYLKFS
jgi:hypothetical protein